MEVAGGVVLLPGTLGGQVSWNLVSRYRSFLRHSGAGLHTPSNCVPEAMREINVS